MLLTRAHVPDQGLDRFLEIVKQAVDDLGPEDSELIELVLPYRQYITGNDKLGLLRRNIEQFRTRSAAPEASLHELSEES
jgi:hypothetical protein